MSDYVSATGAQRTVKPAQKKAMQPNTSDHVPNGPAAASASGNTAASSQGHRPFIVLGDKTSHGGVVITASENTFSNGRRVARVGDLVRCADSRHGTNPIISGCPLCEIDGRRIARHGDLTACGATLIASQWDSGSE